MKGPSDYLAEAALELARKVLTLEGSDLRVARLRLNEATEQAREIIEFDQARQQVVVPLFPARRPNPDQPGSAA